MQRVLLLVMSLMAASSATFAQTPFESVDMVSLQTSAGRMTVRREHGKACDPSLDCMVVQLGDRYLAHDFSVNLVGVYPSAQSPAFVLYSTHGGGNCCSPVMTVVDVQANQPFEMQSLFVTSSLPLPTVSVLTNGRFEFSGFSGERDKLGDPVRAFYIYDRDRREVWIKPDANVTDLTPFLGRYPQDLLADAQSRQPIVALIGDDSFREFRDHISVAGPMDLIDHRWLVGHGCLAHSCTINEGYFVIDLRTGKILAVIFDMGSTDTSPPKVKLWSNMDSKFLEQHVNVLANANDWLKSTSMNIRTDDAQPHVTGIQETSGNRIKSPRTTDPTRPSLSSADGMGPSFDCNSRAASGQPLAQIICADKQLSVAELAYVIAYQALRESLLPEGRKQLMYEAERFVAVINEQCKFAATGTMEKPPTFSDVQCVTRLLEQQRILLIQRTAGPSREEAMLQPEDAVALQQGLQSQSFLPADAKTDGVFGPITRKAIVSWQHAKGVQENGFGSRAMLVQLNSASHISSNVGVAQRIQMIPIGRTYGVPVKINDAVTLNFILDSGASDVSIPIDVFSTLVRAGTIGKNDLIGKETYTLADGSNRTTTTFMIRSLRVGPVVLTNVRGSIAEGSAPLLLGMSFLSRFKSWSVDNVNHVLLLE